MLAHTSHDDGGERTSSSMVANIVPAGRAASRERRVGTRRNRGQGPKIIPACCPTRRVSLRITSAGTHRRPSAGRRGTIVGGSPERPLRAKYFSAPDVVLFSVERSVNPRIQTFVHPGDRGYAVASNGVSVLSSKLPLSFIVSFLPPSSEEPFRQRAPRGRYAARG